MRTKSFTRILKFLIVGGVGVSLNLGIYHLLYVAGVHYLLGSVISVSISTIAGFFFQKYWTFEDREHRRAPAQFVQYAMLAFANIAVNTLIVYVLAGRFGVHYLLAQAAGAATVAVYSFFLYRFVIFKEGDQLSGRYILRLKHLLKDRVLLVLLGVIALLSFVPAFDMVLFVGHEWHGIMPVFTDELNFARIHTIGEGHLTDGNPYFMEHADGPPLVLFGGAWLNAIPMWLGVSFGNTLVLNFLIWSLIFALTLYFLLRELNVPSALAAFGVLFAYLGSETYEHIWRPANLQPVYPLIFLFYAAVLRLLKDQRQRNIVVLGLCSGISFYLFAYWWQTVVITLGIMFVYALIKKDWILAKAVFFSSIIAGCVGLPAVSYTLWLSHTSPHFWESVVRLGFSRTHFSTSFEVYYICRWIALSIALLWFIFWKLKDRARDERVIALFIVITGLSLIAEDSNWIVTGVWYDTEYHIREFIIPWLVLSTTAIIAMLKRTWPLFSTRNAKAVVVLCMALLLYGNVRLATLYPLYFFRPDLASKDWITVQSYAGAFTWLDTHEKTPVVVWVSPHDGDHVTAYLPIYTKHFVLVNHWGVLELVSDDEIVERYLVSAYFDNPSVDQLKTPQEMGMYLGISQHARAADVVNFKIELCRKFLFWKEDSSCGAYVTPASLLGDQFFADVEHRFTSDIKPHIQEYLKKYHVKYILKDIQLDPMYHPEKLGARKVWEDAHFEIWELPASK